MIRFTCASGACDKWLHFLGGEKTWCGFAQGRKVFNQRGRLLGPHIVSVETQLRVVSCRFVPGRSPNVLARASIHFNLIIGIHGIYYRLINVTLSRNVLHIGRFQTRIANFSHIQSQSLLFILDDIFQYLLLLNLPFLLKVPFLFERCDRCYNIRFSY